MNERKKTHTHTSQTNIEIEETVWKTNYKSKYFEEDEEQKKINKEKYVKYVHSLLTINPPRYKKSLTTRINRSCPIKICHSQSEPILSMIKL